MSITLALWIIVLVGNGATNLLPGLRFDDPSISLDGSLVFLYTNSCLSSTNTQIYKLDLDKRSLRVVTLCPFGDLYSAKDAKTFCVLYGANVNLSFYTNAFMYSEPLRITRAKSFEKGPSKVTFGGNHIFFFFDKRVFDYDMVTESFKPALYPGETTDATNVYSTTVAVVDDREYNGYKSVNGRWVFFEGHDSPFKGSKLVSSASDLFHTEYDDSKEKNVRVLKQFPRYLSGSYWLMQLSPSRRYALVRRSYSLGSAGEGWGHTYYAVNVVTGETTSLLEEQVGRIHNARISWIYWNGNVQVVH